jgi:hypothetical protein
MADVTREHRLLALRALCVPQVLNELGPKTRVWVDHGHEHKRHDPAATLVAQAIADAEARGRAESAPTQASAELETEALSTLFDVSPHVSITSPGGHVNCWTVTVDGSARAFDGDTRLEALSKAAAALGVKEGA